LFFLKVYKFDLKWTLKRRKINKEETIRKRKNIKSRKNNPSGQLAKLKDQRRVLALPEATSLSSLPIKDPYRKDKKEGKRDRKHNESGGGGGGGVRNEVIEGRRVRVNDRFEGNRGKKEEKIEKRRDKDSNQKRRGSKREFG